MAKQTRRIKQRRRYAQLEVSAPPPAVRVALERDKRWFAAHPDRVLMIRPPVAGELPALGWDEPTAITDPRTGKRYIAHIFVMRGPVPGTRLRIPHYVRPNTLRANEDTLRALLALLMQLRQTGQTGAVSDDDIDVALGRNPPGLMH